MVTLEQVELLRTKADVTYEEARQALEASNGDLLDAVVLLEIQGKVRPPKAVVRGAQESTAKDSDPGKPAEDANSNGAGQPTGKAGSEKTRNQHHNGTEIGSMFKRFGAWIKKVVQLGNRNNFVVSRGSETILTLPITALVALSIFFFWAVILLIVIGMFTGFKFVFSGPDIRSDVATKIMNSAADAAQNLTQDVKDAIGKEQSKHSANQ